MQTLSPPIVAKQIFSPKERYFLKRLKKNSDLMLKKQKLTYKQFFFEDKSLIFISCQLFPYM